MEMTTDDNLDGVKSARVRKWTSVQFLVDPSLPRCGRVERQVKRAFAANDFRPLSMSEIWPWVYPGIERAKHWHRWSVRCALLKIAKPIGRSPTGRGRPGIWALDTHTENPSK
jgi:hypothetical protein